MVKQDYEAAERQLAVVRRFKNPVVEAVVRLKDVAGLGLNLGETEGGGNAGREGKKAGKRRSGLGIVKPESNLKSAGGNTTRTRMLAEDSTDAQHDLSSDPSRSPSRGRSVRSTGKVHFRRQGSHDDIGLSRSQGSHDGPEEEGTLGEIEGGASAEEEIMRRMWESREVYDKGDEVGVGEGR